MLLLTQLRQIVRQRIQMTASTELAKQKVLHQLWDMNSKNMQKICQISVDIQEEQNKNAKIVTEKKEEIGRLEFDKRRLEHKNNMELNRLMYEHV